MSTCSDDAITDFDLNFLRPTPSSTVPNYKTDKQRKAILIVKKKTIATDSLIKKYYAKREALETAEKSLLSAKEECKQICIDYRKSVDTCSSLEKQLLQLKDINKDLESKCFNLESQFQAVNSHANQLQILVKEHETNIEALKIENKLSKNNDKDCKRMSQPLQKENNMLIRHICLARDIIFGKIKCKVHHKTLLKKYDKYKSPAKDDSLFGEEESNNEYASDEIALSPFFEDDDVDDHDAESSKGKKTKATTVNIDNANIADHSGISTNIISECNDIASIDTGRGSSLAFSVSDKSFHSPDYFINDSPLSDDSDSNKVKSKLVDSATSPVPYCIAVSVSTSPIFFDNDTIKKKNNPALIDRALSPIVLAVETNNKVPISNESVISPRENEGEVISPRENESEVISSCENGNNIQEDGIKSKNSVETEKNQKERECLELNNSDIVSNENSNDCEIEMILNTMKLHNKLITPIPATPAKSHSSSRSDNHCTPNKQKDHSLNFVCPEAVLAREENKKLEASISELAKELINIKQMLINRPIAVHNNEDSVVNNELQTEVTVNENQESDLILLPPVDATLHNMKDNTCVADKPSLLSLSQSNRRFSHTNTVDVSKNPNLYTITEIEENYRDTSTLQSDEVIESINEADIELVDVRATKVMNSQASSNMTIDKKSFTKDDCFKLKSKRRKKITKLGIIKRNYLPKYKIKRERLPLKKRNVKLKQLANINKKKIITANDSSATLNNKNVYEKAVKVMTDLKRKKNDCIDNQLVRLSEKKKILEKKSINDVKYTENEKPTIMPAIATRSRSKVTTLPTVDKVLCNRAAGGEENHEKNHTELKSPKRNLKRTSENSASEIPCKRVFHTTTLECSNDMNPKIVLHRYEELMGDSEYNSAKNIMNTSDVSPKNKKMSPKNKSSLSSPVVSPKKLEVQERSDNCIISNRRKSNKDISSLEASPKSDRSQEICDVSGTTSHRRRSVRLKSLSEASPKLAEQSGRNNDEDRTRNRRNSGRDLSSSVVSLKTRHDNQDLTTQGRKNTKNTQSPGVNSKTAEQVENYHEHFKINRRKSSKEIYTLVHPNEPENQENNDTSDITGRGIKCARILSFSDVSSKVPGHQDNNNIIDFTSNQRKNLKEKYSPQGISMSLESKERNDSEIYANLQSQGTIFSLEVNPKIPNDQERNGSPDISYKKRKNNMCIPEVLNEVTEKQQDSNYNQCATDNPRESVLCRIIQQHGVKSVKYCVKEISDSITNAAAKKIEDEIARIVELPTHDAKEAMNKFVIDIQKWDIKHFLAGLIKYLKDPTRKNELFNKVASASAPALTKPEQVLLYVISELNICYSMDIVDKILKCIEYTLFALNRTPQFLVIESMSHFYAAVCRYFKMKTRLRLFILDAMYCIQFKAVPLIRQCIEVWAHIIPLAHMSTAQTPLVTCLVYLLHFYKCEDKLSRVQDIRNILSRKYFYKVTEWNETKILELLRNSIKSLRDIPAETKMLRFALIIIAKRHGPRWCLNNIVKNLLQPIIEKQNSPEHVKAFCVSVLGPLIKPFPADMKVNCEIVMNQLITILQDNPSPKIAEAVVTSLIYINRHNQFKVIQTLATWKPQNISLELEDMLKDFVKSKPLKIWKRTLSKIVQ